MEGLIILDTDIGGAGDNMAKGEKIAKGLSIGSNSRKRLADISNLQQQRPKPSIQQELHLGNDRLKALQHEIGCKNGLLNVRELEAEEKPKRVTCQSTENQVEGLTKCVEAGESLQADKKDGPCNTQRDRHPKNPLVASHTVEAVEVKEKADNKRGLRRQSARFKTEEHEATEEMLETNGCKILVSPLCNNVVHESETTFSSAEKEASTIEAVQANKKAYHKRQSAKLKTEEQEATEEIFETNGDKIPLSLVRDIMVHASETICPLGGKDDSTSAAVQAKEKAYNNRRFTRQSAKLKTEVREAPEVFGTNGEKFHVSHRCHNVVHESDPTCSVLETEDSIKEAVQAKEKAENKRRLTRQSARFKTEELLETNDVSPLK